jgi:hypothetical protein
MFFKKSKQMLVLTAVHISGTVVRFRLDKEEFNTTLEIERKNLDEFIKASREFLTLNQHFEERDLIAEFGHARIRYNDFSSYSIEEITE